MEGRTEKEDSFVRRSVLMWLRPMRSGRSRGDTAYLEDFRDFFSFGVSTASFTIGRATFEMTGP